MIVILSGTFWDSNDRSLTSDGIEQYADLRPIIKNFFLPDSILTQCIWFEMLKKKREDIMKSDAHV